MDALPTPRPVTRPLLSAAALTWAVAALVEVQLTSLVRSSVVPSLKLPVALSWTEVPLAIDACGGVMVMAVRTAEVTVMTVDPSMPFKVAATDVVPTPTPLTTPATLAALASPFVSATSLTSATVELLDVQVT